MRLLTVLEQEQTSGAHITSFNYDVVGPDHRDQMFLRMELTGDAADIRYFMNQIIVTKAT